MANVYAATGYRIPFLHNRMVVCYLWFLPMVLGGCDLNPPPTNVGVDPQYHVDIPMPNPTSTSLPKGCDYGPTGIRRTTIDYRGEVKVTPRYGCRYNG